MHALNHHEKHNYCCCQEVFAAAHTFKNITGIHFAEKWKVKWTDMCADSSFLLWKWILPEGCDKFKTLMLRKMQLNKSVQWGRTGTLFVSAFRFIFLYKVRATMRATRATRSELPWGHNLLFIEWQVMHQLCEIYQGNGGVQIPTNLRHKRHICLLRV